mgnify:CR=1 FL=1
MKNAIVLNQIYKSYGPNRVFNGLDLTINKGGFYALLGKNGAGKSTLIRIIMRHESYDKGSGKVFGQCISEDNPNLNQVVALVSEATDYALNKKLIKLFKSFESFYPKWNKNLFLSTCEKLQVNLNKRYFELSRGQKMQLVFAAQYAICPEVLLLDEITSVLDAKARTLIISILEEFSNNGGTVVLATNMVSEIHYIADRLILLEGGKVELNFSVNELSKQFIKIRKQPKESHSLFDKQNCIKIGINSDHSVSYILPKDSVGSVEKIPEHYLDRRQVTAEDAFFFFSQKTKENL